MGKYFGTDGFRGEANVDLTVEHAYKVGRFLGWYYGQKAKGERCRIVIGKDSETGLSGAQAAHLVGVLPQNFRKYTAADDAASRQKMSFSMWHLLLHRTGVKLVSVVEIDAKKT